MTATTGKKGDDMIDKELAELCKAAASNKALDIGTAWELLDQAAAALEGRNGGEIQQELHSTLGHLVSAVSGVLQSNQNGNELDFVPLLNARHKAVQLLVRLSKKPSTTPAESGPGDAGERAKQDARLFGVGFTRIRSDGSVEYLHPSEVRIRGNTFSRDKPESGPGEERLQIELGVPTTYAWHYYDGIRFGTGGREINGSKPHDAQPLYTLSQIQDAMRRLATADGREWQPIETAPRTGVAILICSGNWITVGSWNRHRNDWCISSPSYDEYPRDEQPTHWIPLPKPPRATERGGQKDQTK